MSTTQLSIVLGVCVSVCPHIKASVWIPAHVTDVPAVGRRNTSENSGQSHRCEGQGSGRGSLEVAGRANVGFGQLLLLALLRLLVPAAQHVVEVVRRRV